VSGLFAVVSAAEPCCGSTGFKVVTQSDLDQVAAELNDRPRQTLKWKSPCQALDEALL
jgi:IS30 family transposase